MNPAMKTINGKQCVRLIDLAHAWDTTTSNILCTSKPYHIPEKYLHRIDGRIWCELEGLRYRSTATSKSRLTRHIVEFLNSLGKPAAESAEPAATVTTTEPAITNPDTAALIADAHQLAADAFLKASDNSEKLRYLDDMVFETGRLANENVQRLEKLESRDHVAQSASTTVINEKNEGRIQELSGKLDRLIDAVHHNQGKTTEQQPETQQATASQALAIAKEACDVAYEAKLDAENNLDGLTEAVIKNQGKIADAESFLNNLDNRTVDTATKAYAAHGIADKALDTATQAADLAQENADIVSGEIERRIEG